MAERALISAILLVMVISICLYMTEMFIPIGRNMDFRDVCREYLMRMEYNSGLSQVEMDSLESDLEAAGFADIEVSAPSSAKAGSVMMLSVEADYTHRGLLGLFRRIERKYEMSYIRNAIARKVSNR
jgi:hypothetical protein